jgi:plasmid stabilization system protein ParE
MITYSLVVSSTAEKHISKAFDWYKEQQNNLGVRFETAINEVMKLIIKNPFQFQTRYCNSKNQEIRIAFTHKFPYGVHFRITNNVINILAVFHVKQDSKKWLMQ